MDDLGTNVERIEKRYLWRVRKHGHRVHIENLETERAYCQVENCGGKPFDGRGTEVPPGRRLCQNCADLADRNEADYREPSLAVLMGERIAETEPELAYEGAGKWAVNFPFGHTSTVAPKPWKQKKRVNRSKGRKPKRSNVKHPRPFDDPLPW